ncbi:MAG: LacI family DNA-binding transcriptional regulator [Sphaerochaetaceae bacterium]|nr:LacI family DNA-binding transcriptional regulator [Sphaerochaetaceae bacterium]
MNKKATYNEISTLSNVSIATISRFMNKPFSVKKETREKILEAMQKLGMDSSFIENKKSIENNVIIFNIPSLINPIYSEIIAGAKDCANRNRYNLLISEDVITDRSINNFIDMLKTSNAAGLITTNIIPTNLLEEINNVVPVIQCGEHNTALSLPYVSIDDIQASKKAVDYLISLGRRKIAILNGPLEYKYAKDRLIGYQQSLISADIPLDYNLIYEIPKINYDIACATCHQLINSKNRPDAIFAVSDIYAIAAIKTIKQNHLKVPNDIAVIGFDNIFLTYMTSPTITSVSQPKYQLGIYSCSMLIQRINKEESPLESMKLETEIIIRESTANWLKTN